MSSFLSKARELADQARAKLAQGELTTVDLDRVRDSIRSALGMTKHARQRLLVLYTTKPKLDASVLGAELHEPVSGGIGRTTTAPDAAIPYTTVHAALCDGWQVLHMPDRSTSFDESRPEVAGYAFVLQKLEIYEDAPRDAKSTGTGDARKDTPPPT